MTSTARPIVLAYHLVWTAYGWWLPNDPRGSTSCGIASDVIAELGELHVGRKGVQPAGWEIREFYRHAAEVLKFPLLECDAGDRECIAEAFAEVIERERYTCYACAVMRDHVHLVIRKHKHLAEEMIDQLQKGSRLRLSNRERWGHGHPVWCSGGWKVFLDHPGEVWRTIRYVEENPVKMGWGPQQWGFVVGYDNWPLHKGHSERSSYARRMGRGGQSSS